MKPSNEIRGGGGNVPTMPPETKKPVPPLKSVHAYVSMLSPLSSMTVSRPTRGSMVYHFLQGMDQPGKAGNPARGQLNRKK